jgi:hypothetical protein
MDTPQGRDAAYMRGHAEKELQRLMTQSRRFEPFTAQVFRDAGLARGCGCSMLALAAATSRFSPHAWSHPPPGGRRRSLSPRALALEVSNTRFVVGDVGTMTFAEPFDAVVGRFVLLICPEPVAMVRQVMGHVRPRRVAHVLPHSSQHR